MTLEYDRITSHPFPLTRRDVTILESAEKIDEKSIAHRQRWFAIPLPMIGL